MSVQTLGIHFSNKIQRVNALARLHEGTVEKA